MAEPEVKAESLEEKVFAVWKDGSIRTLLIKEFNALPDEEKSRIFQAYVEGDVTATGKQRYLILNPQTSQTFYCAYARGVGGGVSLATHGLCERACGIYAISKPEKRGNYPLGCEYCKATPQEALAAIKAVEEEIAAKLKEEERRRELLNLKNPKR